MPLLRLRNVSKQFGETKACDDVSLEVRRGEIHALLGENGAGKSTLMNLVFGLLHPESGSIEIKGEECVIDSPRDARRQGIGMVHQHFKLVGNMTVVENVALSFGGMGLTKVNLGELATRIERLSDQFNLEVDPARHIEDISVGQQQRVEILKLLIADAETLILDEPTAVLTPPEWLELAEVLRGLAAEGRSIVFISHKLQEIFDIADQCTVLRAGRVVGTRPVGSTSKEELARLMVGRDVALRFDRRPPQAGKMVLKVDDLSVAEGARRAVSDVTFSIRSGEVFGVAGVDGNGQSELVAALIGRSGGVAGEVSLLDEPLLGGAGRVRMDPRVGVVPEDRHRDGVALGLSVADNLMLRDFDGPSFARRGFRRRKRANEHCEELAAEFDIRARSIFVPLGTLSGGNQQKVVLARELDRSPALLIASQPTRGLDIGATEFVYSRLGEFKSAGGATLLLSTELDEVLSLSDRVAVMVNGRFVATLDNADATLERLGPLIGGSAGHGDRSTG